jgi:nitrogen fixation protein FixH
MFCECSFGNNQVIKWNGSLYIENKTVLLVQYSSRKSNVIKLRGIVCSAQHPVYDMDDNHRLQLM